MAFVENIVVTLVSVGIISVFLWIITKLFKLEKQDYLRALVVSTVFSLIRFAGFFTEKYNFYIGILGIIVLIFLIKYIYEVSWGQTIIIWIATVLLIMIIGAIISLSGLFLLRSNVQSVTKDVSAVNQQIKDSLISSTTSMSLRFSDIVVEPNSKRMLEVAVKNNKNSKAEFLINAKCNNNAQLVSSRTIAVEPSQVEVVQMEINSNGVTQGSYFCTINAKSDKGDNYEKDIFINVG